jgi:outer membrane protein assembly factor BamB
MTFLPIYSPSNKPRLWHEVGLQLYKEYNSRVYYITENLTVAFDARDRLELWKLDYKFSNIGFPSLKIKEPSLFLLDGDAANLVDKKTGKSIWHIDVSQPSNLAIMGNRVYIFEGVNRVVHVVDVETGRKIGALSISSPQLWFTDSQDMVSIDGVLLISSGDKVLGYGE